MNIHDDILMLRALEPTDLDVLYRWENDADMWHTSATITPYSRKQLWDYIDTYDGDIFRTRQLRLMIEEISTNNIVGTVDLYDFDPINNRAMVGILIDKAFRNKGYGVKSMKLLENYCNKNIGLNQLIAIVAIDNEMSFRLFKSLGYETVGVLKWWLKRGSEYKNAMLLQKKL